jgi:four helix bundle protein
MVSSLDQVNSIRRACFGPCWEPRRIQIEAMAHHLDLPTRPNDLRLRTKRFALELLRLVRDLPHRHEAELIGRQLLRSGTSVAANYRAACRARSRREFVAKLGLVVEECDETLFWLELLRDSRLLSEESLAEPLQEADELVAIFVASRRTAESRRGASTSRR